MTEERAATIKGLMKALGPGILFAGAAIGGSHLIQSTRAGASYGFELLWAVILINIFKYPFFEYGHRYVAATGESILEGYLRIGKWAVATFFGLSVITAFVNAAAVTIVTAGLTSHFFGITLGPVWTSILILLVTLSILFIGKYPLLDSTMKVMVSVLGITTIISTIIAFTIAAQRGFATAPGFVDPELWNITGVAFLLALMGWMPAPIEVSVWPSLWALERKKQTNYTPNLREHLFDFYVGYIGTAVMALFFLGLGAFVMYGTGEHFSDSGVVFSGQLVALYTETLGGWSFWIISAVVLITMASTVMTVFDAYPRTLQGSFDLLRGGIRKNSSAMNYFWTMLMAVAAVLIITQFKQSMKAMMDFATIISFLAAPVFAIINYKVVTAEHMPIAARPKRWLRALSITGIFFLVGFSLVYIYYLLFI
ncbi:MAG: Nramp family divalent metal transporter [Candidatus Kapaibacterium sp.]